MGARKPVLPVMVVCCVLMGWLLWACGSALAAAPETPEVTVEAPVHATTATVHGVLNPKASSEAGSYEFLYKQGKAGCVGGSKAPDPAGLAIGLEYEEVAEGLSGLEPDTEYTVCLRAENTTTHEEAVSPVVTFVTALPPETPETLKAESVSPTTAMLKGVLNPKANGEAGFYEFLYRASTSECEGGSATPMAKALGAKGETVSVVATELMPGTQYTFCLRASNAAGEAAVGSPVTFMTSPASPSIDSESVAEDQTTSATLQAQVNPNNQKTTYFFEYSAQASGETLEGTVTKVNGSNTLAGEFGDQTASASTGSVLSPGTIYYYRVVASNGTPPASRGKVERFMTSEAPITESAVAEGATAASLKGELNPNGASGKITYQFDYNTNGTCTAVKLTPEEEKEGKQPPVQLSTPAVEVTEGKAVHIQVEAQELEPNEQYTFCLAATNAYGGQALGNEMSLQTGRQAPDITGVSVTNITSGGATVNAQVYPHAEPTTYHVEYGLSEAYGSSTPEVSVSAQHGPAGIQAQLTGLTPDSEYHYRIIATNETGAERTSDATFATSAATAVEGLGLPDNRAYEMVTPPYNHDADVYVPDATGEGSSGEDGEGVETRYEPFQVSSDGSAVTYVADPTAGGIGYAEGGAGDQYAAERSSSGGWTQTLIQPPERLQTVYQGFSSNLSTGVLQSGAGNESTILPPLSEEAPGEGYHVLYQYSIGGDVYRPLFTTAVPLNRSPSEFGTNGQVSHQNRTEPIPVFAGGSADFKDLLFEANDALIDSGEVGDELETDVRGEIAKDENSNYLYDSIEGKLTLIDVSPGGKVVPNATFGDQPFHVEDDPPDFSHVISTDGSRIYWTDLTSGVVYLRDDGTSTVQVSAGSARYWTASADGRYAFYTEDGELYRFDAEAKPEQESREVLTAQNAEVQGVIGASEDAEQVYFVADGVLSSQASGEGTAPQAGQPNLYVSRHGERPVFIATLSEGDRGAVPPFTRILIPHKEWGDWQPGLGERTARVTEDGNSVVFMSSQSLGVVGYPQGYQNAGLDEVYVYNATTDRLYCASCGKNNELYSNNGAAAFLPVSWSDTYLPQWISEDGNRVFFDTSVPLVPQDTNGKQDVYEWELEGTPGCANGAGVNGGCLYLLSGGASNSDSWFIGASASGNDVFVVTRAQLVPEDQNEAFDLYDVRVDGVKTISPPACSGTGCQGVPAPPPTFATPPSVTFNGIGNFPISSTPAVKAKTKPLTRAQKLTDALKVCKKQKRRKKLASCEAKARKRYGTAKKAGKTSSAVRRGKHV